MDITIPYEDLNIGKRVGKGSFGSVFKGDYLGTSVAIKQVHESDDADMEKYFEREVSTLAAARHPNIVQFMGVSKRDHDVYIVTEFCDGKGDLRQLNEQEELPWKKRLEIVLGVARAMAFLHTRGIIHRDMKCENILILNDYTPKVCDFGFARPQDKKRQMTMCGTDWTMAPEIILSMDYDQSVDVFSFGMVLGEVFSRVKPSSRHFKRVIPGFGLDPVEVRALIQPGCPPAAIDLVLRCIDDTPKNRPTFVEVVKALQSTIEHLKAAEAAQADNPVPTEETEQGFSALDEIMQQLNQFEIRVGTPPVAGKNEHIDDIENVFIRRKEVTAQEEIPPGAPIPRFEFVVENHRDYDVRVILKVNGQGVQLVAAGNPAKRYPSATSAPLAVECIIPKHKATKVALLQQLADFEGPAISFDFDYQVFRAQVDIKKSELNGVFLESRVFSQPDISEISFYANNSRSHAIEVAIHFDTDGPLDDGNDNPLVSKIPANTNTPMFVGRIRTAKSISFSWRWAEMPSEVISEQVSVNNGVRLTKRLVPQQKGTIEVHIDNTKSLPIFVEVILTGPLANKSTQQVLNATVPPQSSLLIGSVKTEGDVVMDWKWATA